MEAKEGLDLYKWEQDKQANNNVQLQDALSQADFKTLEKIDQDNMKNADEKVAKKIPFMRVDNKIKDINKYINNMPEDKRDDFVIGVKRHLITLEHQYKQACKKIHTSTLYTLNNFSPYLSQKEQDTTLKKETLSLIANLNLVLLLFIWHAA